MKCKVTLYMLALACITLGQFSESNDEFYEIDVRKIESNRTVQFGAQIFSSSHEKYPEMFQKLGPIFQLAYSPTVLEVSATAPAPSNANNTLMDKWVGSIYWNNPSNLESMELMSKMLMNNSVQLIAAAHSAPNAYWATSSEIIKRRDRQEAKEEDPLIAEKESSLEKDKTAEDDKKGQHEYIQLIPESISDFAKFWASSIEYLKNNGLIQPYIELTWEPDSKEYMFVYPKDYALIVKEIRHQIRLRDIPDDENKIIGPGTSKPTAAKPYIEALVQDKEAYDALYAWSIHIWDEGFTMEEMEHEIYGFKQLVEAIVPDSWPQKRIIVSSFGFSAQSINIYDDIDFNGNIKTCYNKIYSNKQWIQDDLPNSIGQSPIIGVRLLSSLFMQYSLGLNQVIYEQMHDQVWSYSCSGMFDRLGRHKQIFAAFSTFLPYITKGSVVIRKQWQNIGECYTVAVKSDFAIVIALANPTTVSCSRSFSLSGIDVERISNAFLVSYNNGTVSWKSSHPSEALVSKVSLHYDVFPSENELEKVIEFDVVIGPNASATTVISLKRNISNANKKDDLGIQEKSESSSAHSEL